MLGRCLCECALTEGREGGEEGNLLQNAELEAPRPYHHWWALEGRRNHASRQIVPPSFFFPFIFIFLNLL